MTIAAAAFVFLVALLALSALARRAARSERVLIVGATPLARQIVAALEGRSRG